MKEHKIFKPDMMFQECINSCWCHNVKTVADEKLPINAFLTRKGIFALDIIPDISQKVYTFGLPVNKNWQTQKFGKNSTLCFEIYSEEMISINILFQDSENVTSKATTISIKKDQTDRWTKFQVLVLNPEDVRMILFSGSPSNTPNYVIKDIIIKT